MSVQNFSMNNDENTDSKIIINIENKNELNHGMNDTDNDINRKMESTRNVNILLDICNNSDRSKAATAVPGIGKSKKHI